MNAYLVVLALLAAGAAFTLRTEYQEPAHIQTVEHQVSSDTFVNYCKLIRAAFFYGRKFADKKLGLTDADVAWFNAQWVQVFDLSFYQTGITEREFILGARFGEGTYTPFPPSHNYLWRFPDTYFLFHLVKEIGMLHSQYFSRCPSCVEYSLAKINAYLKVTTLKQQIPQMWEGNIYRMLTSIDQADSLHAYIKCLFPAHPVNPVTGDPPKDPGNQCGDTILVHALSDIIPTIPRTFQSCDTSHIDVTGPELTFGKAGRRQSIYSMTFVVSHLCNRPDSCRLYFKISR